MEQTEYEENYGRKSNTQYLPIRGVLCEQAIMTVNK